MGSLILDSAVPPDVCHSTNQESSKKCGYKESSEVVTGFWCGDRLCHNVERAVGEEGCCRREP